MSTTESELREVLAEVRVNLLSHSKLREVVQSLTLQTRGEHTELRGKVVNVEGEWIRLQDEVKC